jgi:hypothetical protein
MWAFRHRRGFMSDEESSPVSEGDADPALSHAVELLALQGRERDAILLVERALREHASDDVILLFTLLLLNTGRRSDRRLGRAYLQRMQWRRAATIGLKRRVRTD